MEFLSDRCNIMVLVFPRRFIYSIYEKAINYKTYKSLEELRKTQWFSEEEIKNYQWLRIENLLKYAYENIPFYKTLFDNITIDVKNGISIKDFQKIPLLNKEIINKNRANLVSTRYKLSELWKDSTSGSTGKKLVFYREKRGDRRNDYFRETALLRSMEWLDVGRYDKIVVLWGSQMNLTGIEKLKKWMKNIIFPTVSLSSYNLNQKMMDLYSEKINQFKPKVILGYASSLYLFANYLDEKKLEIQGIKHIISSAETLYQFQRETIERVFRCKVIERYGSREFGIIAQECTKHKGLHIIAEHVFIEILDKEGNTCKPGMLGEIVITDLDNYCFPFIRYKIGDVGVFSEKTCDCGRGLPLLEKVEGRVFDIIIGTNGNYFTGTFWTILLRNYIKGIREFQVIQEKYGELILRLVTDELFTENEKQKLLKNIHENCGEDFIVDFQLVNEIPLTQSGKNRFVISKISPFLK